MPSPSILVQLALDLGSNDPLSFKLDDPIKGLLDNTSFGLGGTRLFDITDRVLTTTTRRGKSQGLDRIDAGVGSVVVDNSDRLFDPLYPDGLYFGQLIPRREIIVSSNNQPVINGFIEDFDIQYDASGISRVRIDFSDAFSVLANSELDELTPDSELSGARIERILNLPEVDWPLDRRDIDPGNSLLLDADISEGTRTLQYLQLIESSEFGTLFLSKEGNIAFKERNSVPNIINITFTDNSTLTDFTPILFSNLQIVYGSENLYNRIILENADLFPESAIAEDSDSQIIYGIRVLNQSGLLVQDPDELTDLANFLLARFKEPQYRFEAVTVILDTLTEEEQALVLDLEIGDIAQVKFTPSGIPPVIEQYCRVIGVNHDWSFSRKSITLSIERLDFAIFILDSEILGQLDDDRLGY
jgi:hypothetical protein